MNREEQLLKYLDDELTESEVREVKELLAADPGASSILESVREKRRRTLSALSTLNPSDTRKVPAFSAAKSVVFPAYTIIRIAATVVILIGVSLALWLADRSGSSRQTEKMLAETLEMEPQNEDLDFIISPNRCWNERKLPVIIIEIK